MIKLLHVEDDPDIREIAEMSLSITGEFDILQCESGEDALSKVLDFAPDPQTCQRRSRSDSPGKTPEQSR